MERELQPSASKRAFGIVRDHAGPTLEAFGAILAHRQPARPLQVRVNPASVRDLLRIMNAEKLAAMPLMELEGVLVSRDERVPLETGVVVFPGEGRVPHLVFWTWGEAARKGGSR